MRPLCFLACCLAACGDDGVRHTPDAAPHHDGAPDSPIDAALQPVTLTATIGGTPQAGVHVYFQNADSSVVLATTTDATGAASAVMAAGGSVTAIDPYGGAGASHDVYTFEAVKPGDNLILDSATALPSKVVTVTAPIDSTPGILSYEVHTPCGYINLQNPGSGASPSGQVTLLQCGAKTDFVIVARNDAYQIVDYITAHDVVVADQGTVDLSSMTYAAASTRTYSLTNIPTGFTPYNFTDALLGTPQTYLQQSSNFPSDGSATPTTTIGTGTHFSQITLSGAGIGQHSFLDWGPYASTYTADVGARVLPDFSAYPTFDASTHSVMLAEAAGGAAPDAVYASLFVSRQVPNQSWTWQIAAPHGTSITLPMLPTDVFDPNIAATDSASVNGIVILKVPGGYDTARPYLLTYYGSVPFGTTVSGQVTTETIFAGFQRRRR